MGYDMEEEGHLIINKEQAKVVRRIYRDFMEGYHPADIARRLNEEGIPGVSGKAKWMKVTIEGMLRNEKYKGDSLLQKTYTADFLTKKQVKNNGQIEQYYVKDSHPAIIPEEEWEAVQLEFVTAWNRVVEYREQHHERWERQMQEGNPMLMLRARQMIELTKQGQIDGMIPELVQMVLEKTVVNGVREFAIWFKDGTDIEVRP